VTLFLSACGSSQPTTKTPPATTAEPAAEAPPMTATVTTKDGGSSIVFKNVGKKPVAAYCYNAPFEDKGDKRIFMWCDEAAIAPGASITVTPCESCTTVLGPLGPVTVYSAKFADGTRWAKPGSASAPSDGAPLALTPTGRKDWDTTQSGGVKPLYEVQNTSKKPIGGYSVKCQKSDGSDDAPTSVTPNDPLLPGEVTYFSDEGKDCQIISAWFSDNTEWAR
jgi:hypothetical protein